MAILKLALGPVTMTVASAVETEGNFGPQVCFTSEIGDALYISEKSASGQLGRLNLTLESCVGRTLYFEQIKKDGKTFTNIALASGAAASAQAAPAAAPASRAPSMTVPEAAAIYAECVDKALATLGTRCEDAGIPMDASAIQAAAATLFIKVTR